MAKKNSKLKTILGVVAGILAAVLVIGLFAFTEMSNNGFFLRHTVSVESENFKVTNAQMSYFFSTNYTSSVMNNSSTYEYYGLDTSKSLKSQQYPGGGTWYDYFMQSVTVPSVKQLLVLCEAARAANYTLTDDDRAEMEEAIENIKSSAKEQGVTPEYYVMNYYGVGVKLKDVRSAMEISQLAYSYYEHVMAGYSFGESEWDVYYNEHVDEFQKVDYLAYTFSLEDIAHLNEDEKAEGTDTEAVTDTEAATDTDTETEAVTETEAATEADTSAETETGTEADTTASGKDSEHDHTEFKPIVEGYAAELASKKTAEEFYDYIETFLSDVMYASETEEKKAESMSKDLEAVEATAVTYSKDDETLVELFKLDKGATYTHVDDEKDEYTVYFITEPKYREDYVTKDAYMIMLSGTADAVTADLDEINSALKNDASVEKFAELAKEYSIDSATAHEGALYKNIKKNQYSSEELMNWLYSDERKEGEYEVFALKSDSTATSTATSVYYYVVLYKGDGMVKWQYDANEALRNEAYQAEYTKFEEAHGGDKINVDLKQLYKIPN